MAAGVTERLWGIADIVKVLEDWETGFGRGYNRRRHRSRSRSDYRFQRTRRGYVQRIRQKSRTGLPYDDLVRIHSFRSSHVRIRLVA
jgi:hypothetical protein